MMSELGVVLTLEDGQEETCGILKMCHIILVKATWDLFILCNLSVLYW